MPRLRKLYVDLVTADGSVCIAYSSTLELGGLRLAPAGIELYRADGTRQVLRGRTDLACHAAPAPDALTSLRFAAPDGPWEVAIACEQHEFRPVDAPPGLTWSVVAARARVRLTTARGGVLEGVGYADWVDLSRLPRRLGLARLEWGRVHLQGGTAIFTHVAFTSGRAWSAATLWPRCGDSTPCRRWSLGPATADGTRDLDLDGCEISFGPGRVLHGGEAIDGARFPRRVERTLSRLAAGPVSETRWVCPASSTAFGAGWGVHESVHFATAADARVHQQQWCHA